MSASYPTSAKAFTTKTTAQTIDASHINDLQAEVTAVEQDLIAGLPVARGGTGLTSIGASGTVATSNGSGVTWAAPTGNAADSESAVLAAAIFG